ncbi:MAG: aminotransferase class I/II-fold pyridoxal phosphate-dependent enzyme [Chloroflexota bacterium]
MKKQIDPTSGLSTIVNHYNEGDNAYGAHVSPIFQTTTFSFPDVETMQAIMTGQQHGYVYSRTNNPNVEQLGDKYAYLEGIDLIRQQPKRNPKEIVAGKAVSAGMAAISAAVLGRVRTGETVITQRDLYGNSFSFFHDFAPRLGINVVWVDGNTADLWEEAFAKNPHAVMAYTETPANPTMSIVDLSTLSEVAHSYNAWVCVDNTFASPYHQRPLSRGCDIVLHSTTKFLTGHGNVTGGSIISTRLDYMNKDVKMVSKLMGQAPSPMDAWMANLGLKTFELRMERHAANGLAMAQFLAEHPAVDHVYYPGLPTDPGHEVAKKQMLNGFGALLSFELNGGYEAGVRLLEAVKIPTFAVSLGNVDTLIQYPAGMTHLVVPPEERRKAGISDSLVRLSVGIENIEDLLADMDRALRIAVG